MADETVTGLTMRLIRNEIVEECAAIAQKWADEEAEYSKDSAQHVICRNLAIEIRKLKFDIAK